MFYSYTHLTNDATVYSALFMAYPDSFFFFYVFFWGQKILRAVSLNLISEGMFIFIYLFFHHALMVSLSVGNICQPTCDTSK